MGYIYPIALFKSDRKYIYKMEVLWKSVLAGVLSLTLTRSPFCLKDYFFYSSGHFYGRLFLYDLTPPQQIVRLTN